MSTPILQMNKIASEKLENYQSDLIHDGVVIGEHKNFCNEFLWIVRSMGTNIIPLINDTESDELSTTLSYFEKSIINNENDCYHIKNPLSDNGTIEKIDFEKAEELYWQANKQVDKQENAICKIDIFSHGDPSVGIPDYSLSLKDPSNAIIMDYGVFAEEDQEEAIEDFRKDLAKAFENILDQHVEITFDCDRLEDNLEIRP